MKILKYKKFAGLHIVCKKCNKNIEVSQELYKGCKHPYERQKYKAIIKRNGVRRTRDLQSADYNEAIKELLIFREEVLNPITFKLLPKEIVVEKNLVKELIMMYGDWLENVNVPRYEQKIRSSKYIKETIGYVLKFYLFLEKENHNLEKVTIYEIDKFVMGKFYEHLETTIKSPATFNHNLRALKNFYNFLINEMELLIINFPKKMKLKYENPNPTSIADQDFLDLLSAITPENSVEVLKSGVKKNRFRNYTKVGIELCAYTGMRLEEVASLKYSDVIVDNLGELESVIGTDLKFERAHNWDSTKAKKVVHIPISPELKSLLIALNYKENLGIDKYLIAGDENISRSSLAKQLSHSFTFYRKKAKLSDDFSIKHLRKTFLTKLHLQTGLTESMGYQRTSTVVLKNYIDKKEVVKEVKNRGFSYF